MLKIERPFPALAVAATLFVCACAMTPTDPLKAPPAATAGSVDQSMTGDSVEESNAPTQASQNRITCTKEPAVGTRLPGRRTCRTEEEWRIIQQSGQETADHVQRMPTGMPPP